jgi:predicted Ser/Thr protein kinase
MLFAVDLTIMAEKTVIVEARSKAEAACKARRRDSSKKHLLEDGEFTVICSTSGARELRGSEK